MLGARRFLRRDRPGWSTARRCQPRQSVTCILLSIKRVCESIFVRDTN